mgnify:CR=1 FL=1
MDSVGTALLEYGAMGIFAAFLVWQHLSMQKRSDAMIENFQTQLKDIMMAHKTELDSIRGRYDQVIEKHQQNYEQIRALIAEKIAEVDRDTDSIIEILREMQNEKKLKELAKQMASEDIKL